MFYFLFFYYGVYHGGYIIVFYEQKNFIQWEKMYFIHLNGCHVLFHMYLIILRKIIEFHQKSILAIGALHIFLS